MSITVIRETYSEGKTLLSEDEYNSGTNYEFDGSGSGILHIEGETGRLASYRPESFLFVKKI